MRIPPPETHQPRVPWGRLGESSLRKVLAYSGEFGHFRGQFLFTNVYTAMALPVRILKSTHPRYPFRCVWREGGKRQQKFLASRAQAEVWQKMKCAELAHAAPADLPLQAAERAAVRLAREQRLDLLAVVKAAVESGRTRERSVTVEHLVASRLEAVEREGGSKGYLQNLRRIFRHACAAWPGRLACEITPDDVAALIFALPVAPQTKGDCIRQLIALFNFAMARGWAEQNPARPVKPPKFSTPPPGILTPQEARALVAAADPEIRPAIAIGLWAGLRMAEIQRLAWGEVFLDQGLIEVTAAKSKTASRRLVHIEPVLRSILEPAKQDKAAKAKVWPFRGLRLFSEARHRCGWKCWIFRTGRKWPDNALRHSFGSYHLAHFKDAARTALEMGHTTTAMLFAHYRALVTPAAAAEYWEPPK